MTTSTLTATPAPTCTPRRGFTDLSCPLCGASGVIKLDLTAVDADDGFTCEECNETFGVECVRRLVEKWTAVLAFVGQMPVME